MRRWVCIVALLAGFSRDEYAWTVRPRLPIAVERPVDVHAGAGALAGRISLTGAWWRTS